MATNPDPAEPALLEQTAAAGSWGGPSYRYRGATIECLPGGHVCGFVMDGHPLSGRGTFGVVGTITPLVDFWGAYAHMGHLIHKPLGTLLRLVHYTH